MESKNFIVQNSENEFVAKAINNSENENLDILHFVLGGLGSGSAAQCNVAPDYRAYADATYVKR